MGHSGLTLAIGESWDAEQGDGDARLAEIQSLFAEETDAPLDVLARNLRAWTRSHLQTEHVAQCLTVAERARQDFAVLVTIGIGGSDLGARVFHDTFNHPYHNRMSVEERGGAPEAYFTGDTFDPRRLIGLLEMLNSRNLLHKTLFNVISKSGRTGETIATLMIIRETLQRHALTWQNHVVATTELTPASALFQIHQDTPFYSGGLLPVPEGVGGRFSAFSPVGLFFLAMTAGKNETPETRIREAMQSVQRADEDFRYAELPIAYQLARWLQLAEERKDIGTIVFYNYADNSCLGEWFVQLYTESIQERGGGANVIPAKGPTSNHSMLNGILAGPRDKVVLFIHWEELGDDVSVPKDTGIGSLSWRSSVLAQSEQASETFNSTKDVAERLANNKNGEAKSVGAPNNVAERLANDTIAVFEGQSMSQIQTASYRGTTMDFTENGVPNATLILPKRNIGNVCHLMRTLMDTVAVKGRLQGLHLEDTQLAVERELTYRQDAVEGYKQRTREFSSWRKANGYIG